MGWGEEFICENGVGTVINQFELCGVGGGCGLCGVGGGWGCGVGGVGWGCGVEILVQWYEGWWRGDMSFSNLFVLY